MCVRQGFLSVSGDDIHRPSDLLSLLYSCGVQVCITGIKSAVIACVYPSPKPSQTLHSKRGTFMRRWPGSWHDMLTGLQIPAAGRDDVGDRPTKSRQSRHLCEVARKTNQRSSCSAAYFAVLSTLARPSSPIRHLL